MHAQAGGHPPVDVVALTRALVDIDSTTGREGEAARWLAAWLRARGYEVLEQPVAGDRVNVVATVPGHAPLVAFSTHIDCVPPFFPSRVENDRVYGRGACDAKGILAAQVAAAERLRADGESRLALVFVVGEERGSDGAPAANQLAAGCRFLINGEPTDNRLGRATRGVLRLRLRASGRAAHSSFPELGVSAIDRLIDALVELRRLPLPEDEVLGRTHYTVGLISGGVAPNVVSPHAEAEIMFRTVSEASLVRQAIASIEAMVSVEHVLEVPPVKLVTVPGLDSAVFPYTTDIPFLANWGQPLLLGPGSIHVAHTTDEFLSIPELHEAVELYVATVRGLLADVR